MDESAGPEPSEEQQVPERGLARYARPALIIGAVVAVVAIALLVIIFFLDTFNATVYSVGGNNIQDDTAEARDIRGLYTGARAGGIAILVASLVVVLGAAAVLYRSRTRDTGSDGGEDVDFDDLGR